MGFQLEKIVKTYRSLSQIPALIDARLNNLENVVASYWSQRNPEKGKTTKFLRQTLITSTFAKVNDLAPVDVSTESLSSVSPTEKFRAVLRDVDDKQFLEIWSYQNLIRTVDLKSLDAHGNVYSNGEFCAFEWSPDEKRLLYVAEKKIKKSEPFYKRKGKPDTNDDGSGDGSPTKGEEYLYRQDWGEQMVGKKQSVLAEYNIEQDSVEILEGIPEGVFPAHPVYSPDGSFIAGIAYRTLPRKLGLTYCTNRPATIFHLDSQGNYAEIDLKNASVKAPRFTPDGKHLVWLQRSAGGPHLSTMALMKTESNFTANSTPSTVLDVVRTVLKTENGRNFYGLYNFDYPNRCWASNGRLLLSTNQKNSINSYVIDIDTGKITELVFDEGSLVVLDVCKDVVLANQRNYFTPDTLVIGKLPQKGSEANIQWVKLTETITIPELEKYEFKYLDIVQPTNDAIKNSTAIYLGPTGTPDQKTQLIAWPHGGPHSAVGNYFYLEAALFMSLGYALVLINYRGSIGAGQDSLDFLLGKIGTSDVSDCVLAVDTALKQFKCLNPEQLLLLGGSHGGFLVTHLSGQYPDKFKAVVTRNPVIDVAIMSIISDIPDWSFTEAGSQTAYSQQDAPDNEIFLKMRQYSPIMHAHKVKAPTLLQIGSKDLRVPMSQALEYYYRLSSNGVPVRMNLYDDHHQLATVPNEMDNVINSVLWFQEHVPSG